MAIFSFFYFNQTDGVIEGQISNQPPPLEFFDQNRPKSILPAGTMPGSEESVPIMAQQDQSELVNTHTSLNRKRLALAEFDGDETEFGEQTIWPIDPIRIEKATIKNEKKYGIAMSNPKKYLEEEGPTFGEELKSYSVAQWDNITHGNKIEAPPKPKIKLPKLLMNRTQD